MPIREILGKPISWKKLTQISVHWRFQRLAWMEVQVTRFPKTDQEAAPENGQGKETRQAREEAGPVGFEWFFCGRGEGTPPTF